MKKIILFLLFISAFQVQAQEELLREKKERIKEMKIGYITSELKLTTTEAEKFWPIYNSFEDTQFEIRHQKMKAFSRKMNDTNIDRLTEKEANVLLIQMESNEEELLSLRKKLVSNLRAIIPAVKILKLKKAEDDFNRKLLQQYRKKESNR